MESDALAQWTMEAVVDGLRLRPILRQKDVQDFSKRFTREGFSDFGQWMQGIDASEDRVRVSMSPYLYLGDEKVVDGKYQREFFVSVFLNYRNERKNESRTIRHVLNVTAVRQEASPDGMAISQWKEGVLEDVPNKQAVIALDCLKMLQKRLGNDFWMDAPLSRPNMDEKKLLTWAQVAVCDTMTSDKADYEDNIQGFAKYYTSKAYKAYADFRARLEKEKGKRVFSACPMWDAEVVKQGVKDGHYYWIVDVPTIISVRHDSRRQMARTKFRLLIQRVPSAENPAGVAIGKYLSN